MDAQKMYDKCQQFKKLLDDENMEDYPILYKAAKLIDITNDIRVIFDGGKTYSVSIWKYMTTKECKDIFDELKDKVIKCDDGSYKISNKEGE